jgi:hypothetical protein
MKRAMLTVVSFGSLLVATNAIADLVVVVSSDSAITQLSREEVKNIYLGRYRQLPNGDMAYPIDLAAEKAHFYSLLVRKDLSVYRLGLSGHGFATQAAFFMA